MIPKPFALAVAICAHTSAALCALAPAIATAQTPVQVPAINLTTPGTPFNPGVRGQAIPSINQFRPGAAVGTATSLDVARGSSIRGVAGGLEADFYNWRTRSNDQRATTLEYLQYARDYNAELVITANIRGLAEPDPTTEITSDRRFYDTSIATLTSMAADWVRYTNVIAQTYHQGDTITNPQDKAIMDALVWSTAPNDTHALLPAVGEAPLPKVKYWEIGNEPRVGLASSYSFTNSFTFLAPHRPVDSTHKYDYVERYASLTSAMKAVDPTIKVGPTFQWLNAISEREIFDSLLAQQSGGGYLPIDFVGYHPYQNIFSDTTAANVESRLRDVYATHNTRLTNIRAEIAASGRDPNAIEFIASEINVSNHTSNNTPTEAMMGHALGTVEEVFSLARLGVRDAHYWLWPADPFDGTEQPVFKAYRALTNHMGDTILSTYANGNSRLYTTRDSKTGEIAIWGLNFSNSTDAVLQLALANLNPAGYEAELMTLRTASGPTTLFSSNLATYMAGGPTNNVNWYTTSLTGVNLANYQMSLAAATMSVLVLKPIYLGGDFNHDGIVNGSDYVVWRNSGGSTQDYNLWRANFGPTAANGTAAATTAVPEPSICLLFLLATISRNCLPHRTRHS